MREKKMKQYVPITIIIPTYNREKVLVDTIKSYLDGDVLPDEIIIVDQTVPARTLSDLGLDGTTIIKLLHCDTPSLTKARNIGMKNSKNDIILFSDDDVLVDADSVMRFYNRMNQERVALCAGVDVNAKGRNTTLTKNIVGTLTGMQRFQQSGGYVVRRTMRGRYALQDNQQSYKTDWAMGYFFGVKKSLIEKWAVFFDEHLTGYAYAEDLDFSMRYCNFAKSEKLDCVIDSTIYVKHLATQEWRTPSEKAMFYLVANRFYLLQKNFPQYSLWPMKWNNFCYSLMLPKEARKKFNEIRKICRQNIRELQMGNINGLYAKVESIKQ